MRDEALEGIRNHHMRLHGLQAEKDGHLQEAEKHKLEIAYINNERKLIDEARRGDSKSEIFQKSLDESKRRTVVLQGNLQGLNQDWQDRHASVHEELRNNMQDHHTTEYGHRIDTLQAEVAHKTRQIEEIRAAKQEVEQTLNTFITVDTGMLGQKTEIEELKEKYKKILEEKKQIYEELAACVKELIQRNARFLKNEIELTKLFQQIEIVKKQLEQQEKKIEDSQRSIKDKIDTKDRLSKLYLEYMDTLAQLREKIGDREEEIVQLKEMIQDKEEYIKDLNMEIDSKNQALEKLKSKNFIEVMNTGGKKSTMHEAVSSQAMQAEAEAFTIKDSDLGTKTISYKAITSDSLDEAIGKWINSNKLLTPIRRVSPGIYILGTMPIQPRYKDEKLTAFTPQEGEIDFGTFVNKYAEGEMANLKEQMGNNKQSCEETLDKIIHETLQKMEL